MHENSTKLLEEIGHQLDRAIYPVVRNGGLVMPGLTSVSSRIPGKEQQHEQQQRSSRPSTPSGTRTKAWSWQANRSVPAVGPRSSGTAASIACGGVTWDTEDAVDRLTESYPDTQVWHQGEGLWLFVQSALLPDLGRVAGFVIAIVPEACHVRAWGFWLAGQCGASWIGPRHTNYPDGSICAFDAADSTWVFGNPLVGLVDLYSVWAVRHLYFERFGIWPGAQASCHAYERLLEFKDCEHCGCGATGLTYGECCKARDLSLRTLAAGCDFVCTTAWTLREPPAGVVAFARSRRTPPPLLQTLFPRETHWTSRLR